MTCIFALQAIGTPAVPCVLEVFQSMPVVGAVDIAVELILCECFWLAGAVCKSL